MCVSFLMCRQLVCVNWQTVILTTGLATGKVSGGVTGASSGQKTYQNFATGDSGSSRFSKCLCQTLDYMLKKGMDRNHVHGADLYRLIILITQNERIFSFL